MKVSEISRYWAAKELTSVSAEKNSIILKAPFSTPGFTIGLNATLRNPRIKRSGEEKPFVRIKDEKYLKDGTFYSDKNGSILCFDLQKGMSEVLID